MTRYKFFAYFTVFAFVIFWFPDFIWTSLSAFAFITWLAPHNQKVNAIFGVSQKRSQLLNPSGTFAMHEFIHTYHYIVLALRTH
jgi:hypothetical protein